MPARHVLMALIVSVLLLASACGASPGTDTAIDDGDQRGTTDEPTADEDGAGDGGSGVDVGDVDGGAGNAREEDAMDALDGDWYLVDAEGPAADGLPLADRDITLSGEEGQLGGSAGCNSYTAPYTFDGEHLAVGEVVQTEMACEPAEVMAGEQAYLAALRQVDRVTLEGEELVLSGNGGSLRFATLRLPTVPEGDGDG